MFPCIRPLVCLFAAAQSLIAADQKAAVFTSPEQAGPDYKVQGEYVGEGSGAQVVALGDGKFRVVGWRGGLPGTTAEAEKVAEVDAQRSSSDEAKVVFDGAGWKGDITGDTLTGTGEEGRTWVLKRTVRESPTLKLPAPAGAKVLFDGTGVAAWKGGRLEEGLLRAGAKSAEPVGSIFLHIEFRTPFKPAGRGQGRGNSGVYLQDRYEVQVLDSFGLKGENNECGGIYTVAKPRINMCFPPLTWQSYDILFEEAKFGGDGTRKENARLTVWHNGVLIHERVEVPGATGSAGSKEGAEPAPIALQDHGNPVVYRNIWTLPVDSPEIEKVRAMMRKL